jgi:hypothetical protein
VAHRSRQNIAQVHRNHPESAALQKQIRRPQRLLNIPAPHPQQLLQLHTRRRRPVWIESIPPIHKRAHLSLRRSRSQRRNQQTRSPRAGRPANFRQPAARQSSRKRINFRNASGHHLHKLPVAIRERRSNAPGQRRLHLQSQSSKIPGHWADPMARRKVQ